MDFWKSSNSRRDIVNGIVGVVETIGTKVEGEIKSEVSAVVAIPDATSTPPSSSSGPATVTSQSLTPTASRTMSTTSSAASTTIQSSTSDSSMSFISINTESSTIEASSTSIAVETTISQASTSPTNVQSTIAPTTSLPLPESTSHTSSPAISIKPKNISKAAVIGISLGVSLVLVLILLLLLLRRRKQLKDRFVRFRARRRRGTVGTTSDTFTTNPIMSRQGSSEYSSDVSSGDVHSSEIVDVHPDSTTMYEPSLKRRTMSRIQDLLFAPLRSHPVTHSPKPRNSNEILVHSPSNFSYSPEGHYSSNKRGSIESTEEKSHISFESPSPAMKQLHFSVSGTSAPLHESSPKTISTVISAEPTQYTGMRGPEICLPIPTDEKGGNQC